MNKIKNNTYKLLIGFILYIAYYYCPYKIEAIGYYYKVWAHRANSKEKLNSALKYFEGVELDLIYDLEDNSFDVNHNLTESISLNFKDYLNSIEGKNYPFLWLDMKNLNKENCKQILKKLLLLFKTKKYPLDKILIESKKVDLLKKFNNTGFKTSFYLPTNIYKKNSTSLSKDLINIKKVIIDNPEIAISTSFKDYDIINKAFPNHPKYIWALVKPIHFNHFKIRRILKDKSVKIVLLNYHVIIGNR